MDERRLVRVSKFLSRHLRHAPKDIGLTLERGGWVRVDDLLAGCKRAGFPIDLPLLREVVADSDKQRFAFDETSERIRVRWFFATLAEDKPGNAGAAHEVSEGAKEPRTK